MFDLVMYVRSREVSAAAVAMILSFQNCGLQTCKHAASSGIYYAQVSVTTIGTKSKLKSLYLVMRQILVPHLQI